MNGRGLRRLPLLARSINRRARAGTGAEHAFRPRLRVDREAPELLLSPHWDDAALSCWSLLASDRELRVVNVFAGVPSTGKPGVWEAVIGARDPAERARERMAEDARALAHAGRAPLNLSLLDAGLREAGRLRVGLEQLDQALGAEVAAASHVYVPAGIGGHVDHLLTRRYGRMLAHEGMPVSVYADLPYCVFHGWPSWVDAREASPRRNVDAYWQSFLGDLPELPALRSAEVVRLDEPASRAKRQALESYETSLNYAFRRMLADPEFHGLEVRWRLSAQAEPAAGGNAGPR
jgi:hypothetical protein